MHGPGSSSPTSVTIEAGAIVVSGVSDPMAAAEEAIRLLSQRIGRLTRAPGQGGRSTAICFHPPNTCHSSTKTDELLGRPPPTKIPYWRDNLRAWQKTIAGIMSLVTARSA